MSLESLNPYFERIQVIEEPCVLEIGFGYSPSGTERNTGFYTGKNPSHIAIDLPDLVFQDIVRDSKGRFVDGKRIYTTRSEKVNFVAAIASALPFADETFDVILMKNMFGQFFGSRKQVKEVGNLGMLEIGRVLKPEGLCFIFEENTPWEKGGIEQFAEDASIEVVTTVYKYFNGSFSSSEEVNMLWAYLRRNFYNPENDIFGNVLWNINSPNCVVLRKPNEYHLEEEWSTNRDGKPILFKKIVSD